MEKIRIYTDGGCSGNQNEENVGGWGAILEYGQHKKELYGKEINTTNNRMEMRALLSAFMALKKEGLELEVFSDSSYLMDCFRKKWYVAWQKNGWQNSAKKPVENQDLWIPLLSHLEKHKKIDFYRVKGHVNLNSKVTDFDALYEKFCQWNGEGFSYDDFLYITKMNNRADELCNIAMDEIRKAQTNKSDVVKDSGK